MTLTLLVVAVWLGRAVMVAAFIAFVAVVLYVVRAGPGPIPVQPWQISYVDAQAAEAARRGEAL